MRQRLPVAVLVAGFVVLACGRSGTLDSELLAGARAGAAPAEREWRTYLGDLASSQASPLREVDRSNVAELEVAWQYDAGDPGSEIQCSPLVIRGVLYGTSPSLRLFALDASTGEEIWSFNPPVSRSGLLPNVNRGLSFWEDSSGAGRLFYTVGHHLLAVDAETGKSVSSFGKSGRVDLRDGMPRARESGSGAITSNTPGVIFEDVLVLPIRLGEFRGAPPGHIRAFDVRTGDVRWTFKTIPEPGEFGYETWSADSWKTVGGANAWAGMALDAERALVFIPTGSAAFDFYGDDRIGDNLFANTLLALDARTGERVWHYQIVRHDLWDRDLPQPPNLLTIEREGRSIDAVSQMTKTGHMFLFDRETGEPLHPIEEVPVYGEPVGDEVPARTQPLPVRPPPLSRQFVDDDTVTDRTPEARASVLEHLSRLRSGPQFTVPSREGSVLMPGANGGAEWGGSAWDAESGLLFTNVGNIPYVLQLVPFDEMLDASNAGELLYLLSCAGCHRSDRRGDGGGIPSLVEIDDRMGILDTYRIVRDGKGRMPAFGSIPWYQRALLVAYLRNAPGVAAITTSAALAAAPPNDRASFINAGWQRFSDPDGFPATKPPWGTLAAIDVGKGEIVWQVPLGDSLQALEAGLEGYGAESYGGPVVTAGGLLFIAGTPDAKLRAFDKATGKLLFAADLPAAAFATPIVYEAAGRQFVVIAAGGVKGGVAPGSNYVAFALPHSAGSASKATGR
ncbi:MAG: pyrroloquinoline quinone-dependent dehydrogenase [Myxococcota bacterium]|nr:pyrroloquinoline quinone-dependent dehydrogenase [Myxococcota bacterium]